MLHIDRGIYADSFLQQPEYPDNVLGAWRQPAASVWASSSNCSSCGLLKRRIQIEFPGQYYILYMGFPEREVAPVRPEALCISGRMWGSHTRQPLPTPASCHLCGRLQHRIFFPLLLHIRKIFLLFPINPGFLSLLLYLFQSLSGSGLLFSILFSPSHSSL